MSDRRWRVQLGTELVHLAFDLGYHEVRFSDHVVQRLDGHQVAGLRSQLARFEEKFGRPPRPGEPLFFDPDADEPRPVSTVGLEQSMVRTLENFGVSPAWIYAYQHTDGLLPRFDGSFRTESDRLEWEEAVQRYLRLHPGTEPDSEAELQRISDMSAVLLVCQVADDPQHGSALSSDLDRSSAETDHLSNCLRCCEDDLIDGLRTSSEVQSRALELARAWGGVELSELTSEAIEKGGDDLPDSVLLVVAAASWSR